MSKREQQLIEAAYLTESGCTQFPLCGGCTYMNVLYAHELTLKEQAVKQALSQYADKTEFLGVVPAPRTTRYRNKMEFSFGDDGKDGSLKLGMRNKGSRYEVSDASACAICGEDFNAIAAAVVAYFAEKTDERFYHVNKKTGTLRNVIIRASASTGEIMVNIVTTSAFAGDLTPLCDALAALKLAGLTGIIHTVSNSLSDAVKPESCTVLRGKNFIIEKIHGLFFKITPFSFFQTNTEAASLLYKTVVDFCGNLSKKTVLDLYCGTGVMAQILAKKGAQHALGVEIVEEAARAARENAIFNGLHNCRFLTGDVKDVLRGGLNAQPPDIVIVDPPRDGLHPKALPDVAALNAEKIIYVSCKPSSLARDVPLLAEFGYAPTRVKCHDMFPRTAHIESVLELIKT